MITSIGVKRSGDGESEEWFVNDESVGYANHDEHGWAGMAALERAMTGVARIAGVSVIEVVPERQRDLETP